MITNGVNDNGVYWVRDNDNYICSYYYGEGIEVTAEFKAVSQSVIDKLTFEDLKEKKT
jgi:hypothetical protein